MKLMCIETEPGSRLIIGNIYEGEQYVHLGDNRDFDDFYQIKNEVESNVSVTINNLYAKAYFIPLAEYREQRINKILN